MFEILVNNLSSLLGADNEDIAALVSLTTSKSYHKNEVILREGEVCKNFGFILRGIIRIYHEGDTKEITMDILKENEFFSDFLSVIHSMPSQYNIVAIEDTDILYIGYNDVRQIIDSNPKFAKFYRAVLERDYALLLRHNNSFKILSPTERYQLYLERRGDICDRVPLKYVASMLNMDQATLSRVRSNLKKEIG